MASGVAMHADQSKRRRPLAAGADLLRITDRRAAGPRLSPTALSTLGWPVGVAALDDLHDLRVI